MTSALGTAIDRVVDGENNPLLYDIAYPLRADPVTAIDELRARHGAGLRLLPFAGASAGGGIFQVPSESAGPIVGLQFEACHEPRVQMTRCEDLTRLERDAIAIDADAGEIAAGAAITLDQLNRALAQHLGSGFKVPGADLTSYAYAAAGATFMTGGMGPQRRYFSDSVREIALFDGEALRRIEGSTLGGYAGTYGWTGLVTALRCRFVEFPAEEVAFALPVSHEQQELARVLAHFAPFARLEFDAAGRAHSERGHHIVLGIEHVGLDAMSPLLRSDSDLAARARELAQNITEAGADGLLFVNGFSDVGVDEFLGELIDDPEADELHLGGVPLMRAEMFRDGEEMRALREAVPYAARMQMPAGQYLYKNHSDANVRLPRERVSETMARLWQVNSDYIARVRGHFAETPEVSGEILVYGHLNPVGVDPHNRVTMSADDPASFERSREFLIEARALYYRQLAELCKASGAAFVGGEKTADSELAILAALDGPENAPAELRARFELQRETVRQAHPMFNWRAPDLYG